MSIDHSPEEIPEVVPVPKQQHCPTCSHCGGIDIMIGLTAGLTAEVGEVGVKYEATGRFLGMALMGNEPLRLDICKSCGTVTRIYLKETERKWK